MGRKYSRREILDVLGRGAIIGFGLLAIDGVGTIFNSIYEQNKIKNSLSNKELLSYINEIQDAKEKIISMYESLESSEYGFPVYPYGGIGIVDDPPDPEYALKILKKIRNKEIAKKDAYLQKTLNTVYKSIINNKYSDAQKELENIYRYLDKEEKYYKEKTGLDKTDKKEKKGIYSLLLGIFGSYISYLIYDWIK